MPRDLVQTAAVLAVVVADIDPIRRTECLQQQAILINYTYANPTTDSIL